MNGLKDVTGTAFIVAEFRVRENAEAHPLYVDPIAPIFSMSERSRRRTLSRPASRQLKKW